MKICSLLLALFFLMGCGTSRFSDQETPNVPTNNGSTTSSDSFCKETWFQEQVQLAEEFRLEHQELLDGIAAEILAQASQFPALCEFCLQSFDSKPYLVWYNMDPNVSQSDQPDDFKISEELNALLEELYVIHPMSLSYYTESEYHSEHIDLVFAYASIGGGRDLYDVSLICQLDTEPWTWEITSGEHYMDGL